MLLPRADEVSYGKKSLIEKDYPATLQKFANLRAYYGGRIRQEAVSR